MSATAKTKPKTPAKAPANKPDAPKDPNPTSSTNPAVLKVPLGMTRLVRVQAIPMVSLRILKADATWIGNASYRFDVSVEAKHLRLRDNKLPEGNLTLSLKVSRERINPKDGKPESVTKTVDVGIPVTFKSNGSDTYSLLAGNGSPLQLHCVDHELIGTGTASLSLNLSSFPFSPTARFEGVTFDGSARFDHPVGEFPSIESSPLNKGKSTLWIGTPVTWEPKLSARLAGCVLWFGWVAEKGTPWSTAWVYKPPATAGSTVQTQRIYMGISYDFLTYTDHSISIVFPRGNAVKARFFCQISKTTTSPRTTIWESDALLIPKPKPSVTFSVEPVDSSPGKVKVSIGSKFDLIDENLKIRLFTDVAILYPKGGVLMNGRSISQDTTRGIFGTLNSPLPVGESGGVYEHTVLSPENTAIPQADLSKISFQAIFLVKSRKPFDGSDASAMAASQYLDLSGGGELAAKPVSDILKKSAATFASQRLSPTASAPAPTTLALVGLTNADWYFGSKIVSAKKSTTPAASSPKSKSKP